MPATWHLAAAISARLSGIPVRGVAADLAPVLGADRRRLDSLCCEPSRWRSAPMIRPRRAAIASAVHDLALPPPDPIFDRARLRDCNS